MTEKQNIEWKETWRDEYLKWICGFANAVGGKLYIGKDDNGNSVNIENPDKMALMVADRIKNNILK